MVAVKRPLLSQCRFQSGLMQLEGKAKEQFVFGKALYYYLIVIYLASPLLALYMALDQDSLFHFEFILACASHLVFLLLLCMYLVFRSLTPLFVENFGLNRIEGYYKDLNAAIYSYLVLKESWLAALWPFLKIFILIIEAIHLIFSTYLVAFHFTLLERYFTHR